MGGRTYHTNEDVTKQLGFSSDAELKELVAGLSADYKEKLKTALLASPAGGKVASGQFDVSGALRQVYGRDVPYGGPFTSSSGHHFDALPFANSMLNAGMSRQFPRYGHQDPAALLLRSACGEVQDPVSFLHDSSGEVQDPLSLLLHSSLGEVHHLQPQPQSHYEHPQHIRHQHQHLHQHQRLQQHLHQLHQQQQQQQQQHQHQHQYQHQHSQPQPQPQLPSPSSIASASAAASATAYLAAAAGGAGSAIPNSAEPWKIRPSALLLPETLEPIMEVRQPAGRRLPTPSGRDSFQGTPFPQPLPRRVPETFVPPPNLPSPAERAGEFLDASFLEALRMQDPAPGLQPPLNLQELKEAELEAMQQTPSPAGTQPSSRSRGGSSTTVGDAADAADSDESTVVAPAPKAKKQNRSSKLKCDIILKVTVEEAREFQLVPRLIGANGRNMKSIVDTYGAKIRIRGRGSGYYETKGMREADIPLQMVYRAEDKANFEAGLVVLTEQLEAMGQRFARFCQSRNTAPPSSFYEVRR